MAELIAITILVFSLIGIGVILFRKIPALVELPERTEKTPKENLWLKLNWLKLNWLKLKERIRNTSVYKNFFSEIFLQKLLSKVRVLTLKIENKITFWLQKLREKSQKKKTEDEDNYWKKLKKLTRK